MVPGSCDAHGGLGHHGVDGVELRARSAPVSRTARRRGTSTRQPASGTTTDAALDGGTRRRAGSSSGVHLVDDRAVVGDPLGEQVEQRRHARRPVVAGAHGVRARADAAPAAAARIRARTSSRALTSSLPGALHQSRKVSPAARWEGRARRSTPTAGGSIRQRRVPTRANQLRAARSRRPCGDRPWRRTSSRRPWPHGCDRLGCASSTTWARRWTSTDGMSILTGQTS